MPRYALFVTGAPASGKSLIAGFLAETLRSFALLEKDALKEALYEELHGDDCDAAAFSKRLSDTAIRLMWTLAPNCPRVILEANFRTLDAQERERFQTLKANKLEVHCRCEAEEAMRRFAARAGARHPAHTVKELTEETYRESQAPFGLGPLIEVDTTAPVDLTKLLERVRAHWPDV